MTAPFEVGDRVVCPDPDDGWFIGTVAHIDGVVLTVTYSPTQVVRARAEEVRPVMPRGPEDIDKYGRYWRRGDKIGGFGLNREYFFYDNTFDKADPSDDWRGPVQPPPEVRS